RLNKIRIAGPQVTGDQVSNHAEVQGNGSMVLESATTLQGNPLPQQPGQAPQKSTPVYIYWQRNITLDRREVPFDCLDPAHPRGAAFVRSLTRSGDDPLAAPPPGSGARARTKPDDQMKLTRIRYTNSMYADRKINQVTFHGGVEVFNLPSKDPDIELDKTKLP